MKDTNDLTPVEDNNDRISQQLEQLRQVALILQKDKASHKIERYFAYAQTVLIVVLLIAVVSMGTTLSRRSPILAHLECREELQDERQKIQDQRAVLQDGTESAFFELVKELIPQDPTAKPNAIAVRQDRDDLLAKQKAKVDYQKVEQKFQKRVEASKDPNSDAYCGEIPGT